MAAKIAFLHDPMRRKSKKSRAESRMVTGSVITQEIRMFRTVFFCRFFFPLPTIIVPATPEERTCVVETGSPKKRLREGRKRS